VALAGLTVALLGFAPRSAAAQSVSPPIAEYTEKGSGAFTLSNETIFPLTAVLDIRGFEVNEKGELRDVALDTARVKVKLSQLSVRIPARQSSTIVYSAEATGGPAWFQIMSAITGARTQNGINLRIELPHVVYLSQKAPLLRTDVLIKAFVWDSAHQQVLVRVENGSDRLARVQEFTVTAPGAPTARGAPFPFFPYGRRLVTVPWTSRVAPAKVAIKFAKFTIESGPVALEESLAAPDSAVPPPTRPAAPSR
jgi:hypothetical protein